MSTCLEQLSESRTTSVTSLALPCAYCGTYPAHTPSVCPRVKAVEYHPNGMLKRVEKFAPNEYYPVSSPSQPWFSPNMY
jgi:hypothetical protein